MMITTALVSRLRGALEIGLMIDDAAFLPQSIVGIKMGQFQPHPILTDEAVNYLGHRFVDGGLQKRLNITFAQYLTAPDVYEAQADALRTGHGINIVAESARITPKKKQPNRDGWTTIEL